MSDSILVHISGKVATVEINRPEAKNALDRDDRVHLKNALTDVAKDANIRAVVLTGAGSAFCAGGNLNSRGKSHSRGLTWSLLHDVQPALECIARMDKPVIAAVNGPGVGFGMSLALACDLMVMDEKAFFLPQFSKLGLIPDGGATWYLTHRVGYARMFEIIADANKLEPQKCLDWGITNKISKAGEARQEAEAWATKLAALAPTGMRYTKRLARMAMTNRLEETLAMEAEFQSLCSNSPDTHEAVKAFMEKRDPDFTGLDE